MGTTATEGKAFNASKTQSQAEAGPQPGQLAGLHQHPVLPSLPHPAAHRQEAVPGTLGPHVRILPTIVCFAGLLKSDCFVFVIIKRNFLIGSNVK